MYRIESAAREYRGTETTGESRVQNQQDQSRMRECTEMTSGTEILQSRECSARGRDEGTGSREYRVESTEYNARMQMREYKVESTKYRIQRESTQR